MCSVPGNLKPLSRHVVALSTSVVSMFQSRFVCKTAACGVERRNKMTSKVLEQVEKATTKLVARPSSEVLAELKTVASNFPAEPAPYLAMAALTGFNNDNLTECKQHLAKTGQLLKAGSTQAHTAEWDFVQALYDVMTSELFLLETNFAKRRGARLNPAQQKQSKQAIDASKKGQATLATLVSQVQNSALLTTIYAAMQVHTRG